jgi:4-alpha-glucanotransferase/alpha-amylase
MRVAKTVLLDGSTVSVRYRLEGARIGTWRTTLDLAMPSCDGVGGRYLVDGEIRGGFGQPLDLAQAPQVVLDDRHLRGSVAVAVDPPGRFTGRPYHTVSQSEEGFERIMQSATVSIEWEVAGGTAEFTVRLRLAADAS